MSLHVVKSHFSIIHVVKSHFSIEATLIHNEKLTLSMVAVKVHEPGEPKHKPNADSEYGPPVEYSKPASIKACIITSTDTKKS